MKKLFLGLSFLACFSASGYTAGWSIQEYDIHVKISSDRSVTVEEKITADFTQEPHHGIYRYIPMKYMDRFGQAFRLRTKLEEVRSSKPGDQYSVSWSSGRLYVKIGNPNRTYQEVISYTIRYTLENAISTFPSHDEFYWNATGNEWDAPMENVHLTVELPKGCESEKLQYAAFLGFFGNKESSSVRVQRIAPLLVGYEAQRGLGPYEGLTVVLGLPLGVLNPVDLQKKARWFLEDNWPYAIPIAVLIFLLLLWRLKGRDPRGGGTVVVSYESPENLTPGEVGTLIDEKVDMRDIMATLIDLAVKGYLKIEEEEDHDFVFRRTNIPQKDSLKIHEKFLLDSVFAYGGTCRLSSLKYSFSANYLKPMQEKIYDSLIVQGYFKKSPDQTRKFYQFWGILSFIAGGVLAVVSLNVPRLMWIGAPLPLAASGVVSGLLFLLFAPLMPQKTREGVLAYEKIKGLEEYIARAEAETLQKVDPKSLFEKLLPFAICFGLTKPWVKAFESLFQEPPQWYSSRSYSNWNMIYFSRSLNEMGRSTSQTFSAVPRTSGSSGFGGGGFSGGGFGGGGGGAW